MQLIYKFKKRHSYNFFLPVVESVPIVRVAGGGTVTAGQVGTDGHSGYAGHAGHAGHVGHVGHGGHVGLDPENKFESPPKNRGFDE